MESHKIVTVAGAVFWPRWSPEGSRIRFTVRDAKNGTNSLWEVGRDGTRARPLLLGWNSPPAECCGTWSPDGKFFFFQSTQNEKTNIWVLREAWGSFRKTTSAPVLLTTGGMNYFAPTVSRDGKQIFVKGAVPRGEVVQYDANSRQFVPYLAGISAENLDFSRDGRSVIYVSYPEGTLWRSTIDGRDRVQLTFSPMRVFLPRWSPDAKRIAFAAKLPGRRWKIYVISAAGGRPEQVTHGDDDEGDVSWSSATTLVFGAMGVGLQSPTMRAIQILDLTTLQVSTIPGSQGLYSPRSSPDGRYIAAMPVEQDKLMVYNFRTKKWAQWPVSNPLFLSWSRDGRYIYFNSALTSEPAFLRVGISDGKVEKVADLKNVRPASSLFGAWSGLTPDDSPLLLRDTGTKEIFALNWQEP